MDQIDPVVLDALSKIEHRAFVLKIEEDLKCLYDSEYVRTLGA